MGSKFHVVLLLAASGTGCAHLRTPVWDARLTWTSEQVDREYVTKYEWWTQEECRMTPDFGDVLMWVEKMPRGAVLWEDDPDLRDDDGDGCRNVVDRLPYSDEELWVLRDTAERRDVSIIASPDPGTWSYHRTVKEGWRQATLGCARRTAALKSLCSSRRPPVPATSARPWKTPGLGMEFVFVSPGSFVMGSDDEDSPTEQPKHTVRLSRGYWIGRHEVTQRQFELLMEGSWHWRTWPGADTPATHLRWTRCADFCAKLTEREREAGRLPPGYEYRLPTEAEWEFAARGGNRSEGFLYSGSNRADDVAWFAANSNDEPHAVGTKAPNELGLYDMSGNVSEWCLDRSDDMAGYSRTVCTQGIIDPCNGKGDFRVFRGGCFGGDLSYLTTTCRDIEGALERRDFVGFRAALAPEMPKLAVECTLEGRPVSGAEVRISPRAVQVEWSDQAGSVRTYSVYAGQTYTVSVTLPPDQGRHHTAAEKTFTVDWSGVRRFPAEIGEETRELRSDPP